MKAVFIKLILLAHAWRDILRKFSSLALQLTLLSHQGTESEYVTKGLKCFSFIHLTFLNIFYVYYHHVYELSTKCMHKCYKTWLYVIHKEHHSIMVLADINRILFFFIHPTWNGSEHWTHKVFFRCNLNCWYFHHTVSSLKYYRYVMLLEETLFLNRFVAA